MKLDTAANILAKIGNPTRLKIVRLLVRAGDDGLPVGMIQKKLGIPGSTLTHHITHLKSAGVIRQQRQQATLICKMEFDVLRGLVDYLTEECCADTASAEDAA
ncbi:MAG: helix-turn-helix transcriptional regulator [Gammaproteobacteria bacterium]|nr:helix-turn-helix transcriptional regulator [Gammaproteobacteria bacterium]